MFRLALSCLLLSALTVSAQEPRPLKILFLGDDGHHRPIERFRLLEPALAKHKITLVYTDTVASLNPKVLAGYDGLVIYANQEKITPDQEKSLLEFVESGKGLVPLHCASFCFLNSPKYIELVGAQFQKHGTGTVTTTQQNTNHPILKNFRGFSSWDETYVHTKHNDKDRTVLEVRDKEPWTWTRTHGKGRVFYTAWGHDAKTWSNPGFQNLVERGIRWAVGDDPTTVAAFAEEKAGPRKDLKPFEYFDDVKVPFYPAGQGWGKTTDPITKMQKPVEAAESIKHMVVPKGMKVELFAAEPLIYRPICMNWDEKGRLWIAETVDYPNELKKKGEGRDRIVIVEDTNGDGLADKTTVFADKLSIPTSFAFANGGIVVLQAPDTLFLKDTDGDGKADERKVLFTGWNTNDTHAGPSNLVYGFDNWLYGIVGYAGFDGTVGGEKQSFKQGFFRMKPDGSKIEFLRNTNNNSWGVGFSEDGSLFGSTANGNASNHLPIPNRYYEKVRGWSSKVLDTIADSQDIFPITDRVRQVDHHGHFTAAAGHALYTARTYPKEYWNQIAFVTEPTGHLVSHFKLEPKGASYVAKNIGSFLASDDEWTSPIMAEVGPDGNMWVIDWYNYIIQHNPTPPGFKTGKGNAYETPLRDKTHGRVVRVVHADGKVSPPPKLDVNDPKTLVAALKHDNLFWRRHAQRLIAENKMNGVWGDLTALVRDPSVDETGLNVGAIHALWAIHGFGYLEGWNTPSNKVALDALEHKSAAVRRAALQVSPRGGTLAKAIGRLDLLNDRDPQVRLAAFLALAETPRDDGAEAALVVRALRSGLTDSWLLDAATCAAAAHDVDFFAALKNQNWGDKKESFAWTPVLERVANHYARGGPTESVGEVVASLPKLPGPLSASLLSGLAKGWPADKTVTLSPEVQKSLADYALATPDSLAPLIQLNRTWKIAALDEQFKAAAGKFLERVRDEKAGDADRVEAAQILVDLRRKDPAVFKELAELLTPRTSPVVARGVLDALGKSEIPGLGKEIVGLTPGLTPGVRPVAIRVLLMKPEWTRSLLDGLDGGVLASDALSLDQKQSLMNHPVKSLAARAKVTLAKSGGLPSPDRQKVVAELMPLTKETGDATLGKAVFVQHCAKCHRHGAEGAKIGPDLTGMAVHPKDHLLVEIMDPNKSVEGNFRQYVVTTKAGRVLTGLLASESKTAIEIIDSEAKTQTLQRDDIDELVSTPKSLMPEGFEKQLKDKDLINLLTFLTQRGQYLPIPLGKAATTVSTKGMFVNESAGAERLVFAEWTPQTVDGVPFQLVDPQEGRTPNVIVLAGPKGSLVEENPKSVSVPCNAPAKAIHLLSGVAGWAFPGGQKGSVSMIVRLHYADGMKEDHPLKNGEHFADYIRRVDVPGSKFAFALRGQQIRYLAIQPKRDAVIESIEFVKGNDGTAPVVMAVTVEPKK